MVEKKYIVSVGNYEGGLLGLSVEDESQVKDGDLETEYAFSAIQV